MKLQNTILTSTPYGTPSCTVLEFAAEAALLGGSPAYTDGNPGELIDGGEEYIL